MLTVRAKNVCGSALAGRAVAILCPSPVVFSVPCLVSACQWLAASGVRVTVFTTVAPEYAPPAFESALISVIYGSSSLFEYSDVSLPTILRGRGSRPYTWLVRRIGRSLRRLLLTNPRLMSMQLRSPFLCVIGVEPEGLVDAERMARILSVPFVYWSLELIFQDELKTKQEHILKSKECRLSRKAPVVVTQDSWRGDALVRENALEPQRVVFVPNSPLGQAMRERGTYLQSRFGMDPSHTVVLCAGTFGDWSMSAELVRAAQEWPQWLVLVMHSRVRVDRDRYAQDLVASNETGKVLFSLDPLSPAEYDMLLDSADIGVALYQETPQDRHTGRNIELMGLSSGKFAAYLRHGLPVIVSEQKGPRDLVQRYDCGVVITSASQVLGAAKTILARYDEMSANAIRCFDRELAFEDRFSQLMHRIACLGEQPDPSGPLT